MSLLLKALLGGSAGTEPMTPSRGHVEPGRVWRTCSTRLARLPRLIRSCSRLSQLDGRWATEPDRSQPTAPEHSDPGRRLSKRVGPVVQHRPNVRLARCSAIPDRSTPKADTDERYQPSQRMQDRFYGRQEDRS
jgi:hypothetical protein